jgi:hypothetical protein
VGNLHQLLQIEPYGRLIGAERNSGKTVFDPRNPIPAPSVGTRDIAHQRCPGCNKRNRAPERWTFQESHVETSPLID